MNLHNHNVRITTHIVRYCTLISDKFTQNIQTMFLNRYLFPLMVATGLIYPGCGPGEPKNTSNTEQSTEPTSGMSQLETEHQLHRPGYADSLHSGLIPVDDFKGSARREALAEINGAKIRINYGSPGKRGRVLWNGLISYDQVWVTGSHWATAIEFGKDVKIGDVVLPSGMYGLFTIPGRQEWIIIINKRFDQHLADDYQESEDMVRHTASPEILDKVVERLTYTIEKEEERKGKISMAWDQIRVSLPFEIL